MNLEACTRKACSGTAVLKAAGLESVTCEGKGSCWLIALLASFEGLINNPRNLTLQDRAVDLAGRQDVLEQLQMILRGTDDELGGLLHAAGDQLRKVFRQLLQLPQASSRRRGQATADWYNMEADGSTGGWQGDLCYQVLAQYFPAIPCPTPCCPRARPACCPATLVSSPSHSVRRCPPLVPLALYTPLPCALTCTARAQNAWGDHRRLGHRSRGKRGLRQAYCARAPGRPSMGEHYLSQLCILWAAWNAIPTGQLAVSLFSQVESPTTPSGFPKRVSQA